MRSSSPGSWDDLLWRLRAEMAAAEAGDFAAVAALAAAATVSGPPPDLATEAMAVHLHERLVRLILGQVSDVQRRLTLLSALVRPDRGRLDVRL
jgi:hypothetical protein